MISADPDRLLQITWNLLSNAVKFTPNAGTIEVKVTLVDHYLQLSVTDSGIGIDPTFLPFVFDRFSQHREITEVSKQGLGWVWLSFATSLNSMAGQLRRIVRVAEEVQLSPSSCQRLNEVRDLANLNRPNREAVQKCARQCRSLIREGQWNH